MTVKLCEMASGDSGDFYGLMTGKHEVRVEDNKSSYRVTFADIGRKVVCHVPHDDVLFRDCRDAWKPGRFYRINGICLGDDGSEIQIRGIRPVDDGDRAEGFRPENYLPPPVKLCEMSAGDYGDFFVLMVSRETRTTKNQKPFYHVTFQDAKRKAAFPIWSDHPLFSACRDDWQIGEYYKVRGLYSETKYGPQFDIDYIRPVKEQDRGDGFDEAHCQPGGEFDGPDLFDQLVDLARTQIGDRALTDLTVAILTKYRETLLDLPAAAANHHAHRCGFLVHVLSVTRNAIAMIDKYGPQYEARCAFRRDLVVAGAILHDIGKARELCYRNGLGKYEPCGELIGHILLGRDILREAHQDHPLDEETLLRLEHIIVSHHRVAEYGSPKPPMTPEALIVHFADDLDAKLEMMVCTLLDVPETEPLSVGRSVLGHKVFRSLLPPGDA